MKTVCSIWKLAVEQLFATTPTAKGALFLTDEGGLMLVGFDEPPPGNGDFVCVVSPTMNRDWIARQLCAVFNDNAAAA